MSSTRNNQPYFPHYANSRNEDNMVRLRMAHGVAGYGVYHMLLERLRMSEGYKCELDYEILSWDLDCDVDLIRSVIYDFGLFEIVDDGQMFCSIELNSYMNYMEEKAAERKAKAEKAANTRWGNNVPQKQDEKTASQPTLPFEESEDKPVNETERLDKEIEAIKGDNIWLDEMAKESGKSKDEIVSFIPEFRSMCMLRGLKGGHKDMKDALTHFRSWIYKSGRAKDPHGKSSCTTMRSGRLAMETAPEIHKRLDEQAAARQAAWEEGERKKVNPRIYIMNKGYDPDKVSMIQFRIPGWEENNPPTHPEWIGAFSEPIEVPY